MAKNKMLEFRKRFAEYVKAKKFVRDYYAENGEMPASAAVNEAKALTPEEVSEIEFNMEVDQVIGDASLVASPADWAYIWNEETWNDAYNNGILKTYYEWADGLSPYKEDLWNQKEQRAANWNDIVKESGVPVEFEDGYHYVDSDGNPCVRCWLGAVNAPGAKYPWCAVTLPKPFKGKVNMCYDGGDVVFPWGNATKEFVRGFAIASIPEEIGMEYILDKDGKTTFDPTKLVVTKLAVAE